MTDGSDFLWIQVKGFAFNGRLGRVQFLEHIAIKPGGLEAGEDHDGTAAVNTVAAAGSGCYHWSIIRQHLIGLMRILILVHASGDHPSLEGWLGGADWLDFGLYTLGQ